MRLASCVQAADEELLAINSSERYAIQSCAAIVQLRRTIATVIAPGEPVAKMAKTPASLVTNVCDR